MNESSLMHLTQRTHERDRNAEKFRNFQRVAEQAIERFAARILEYKHGVSIATGQSTRPHCPCGVKLTCDRVFVLEPPEIGW